MSELVASAARPRPAVTQLLVDAFHDPGLEARVLQVRPYSRIYRVETASHPGPLVVKEVLRADGDPDPASAREFFAGHELAARAFPAHPRFGVVKVLPMLTEHGFVVTEWLDARPMRTVLAELQTTYRDAVHLVGQAGAWLQQFHRCAAEAPAPLDAAYRYERVLAAIEAAPKGFSRRPLVRAGLATLAGGLERVERVAVPRAWIHGDFTTDNLLVARDGRIVGIDFDRMPVCPVLFDFEQFLLGLDLDLFTPRMLRLRVVRRQLYSAFRRGYEGADLEVPLLPERWLRLQATLNRWALRQVSPGGSFARRQYFEICYARVVENAIADLRRGLAVDPS